MYQWPLCLRSWYKKNEAILDSKDLDLWNLAFLKKKEREKKEGIAIVLILNGFTNLDVRLCQIAISTTNMKLQTLS